MKNIVFVFPNGSMPVPTVNGGAIEKLIEILIEQNEITPKFHFHIIMCKNKNDKTTYDYSKYKHATFYDFYMSAAWSKVNKLMNAGNKRLGYGLPLYSPYDKFINKTIKDINPDLVIFEGSYTAVMRLLNKTVGRDKLVYHIHHQITKKRDLSKFFSKVICVSEFIKTDWLKNFEFKRNIEFITLLNGIDTKAFSKKISEEQKRKLREGLGFADDDFVLIYVGRLIAIKGIDKIIKALKLIDQKNIKLMILGESVFKNSGQSSYTKYLANLAKDAQERIKFTGYIDNQEIYKYYAISNCFILASVCEEAAPLTVLESKQVGIPQIITNSGGAPEFARKDAIIVKKEKDLEQGLADAITMMYNKTGKLNYTPENVIDGKLYFSEFIKILDDKLGKM